MSADTIFRQTFTTTVSQFVEEISNHPDISTFTFVLLAFLLVLVVFQEIAKFMLTGFDAESIINTTFMTFLSIGIWVGYAPMMQELIDFADKLGLLFLRLGTGNSDPFFLFKWVTHSLKYMHGEEVSLWDMSIGDLLYAALWYVVAFCLALCMYFIGAWAIWTLALAKVLALVFVPFLMHPGTRFLFDGFVKFFLGSVVLLFVLRATGVLVALGIKAQFAAMGAIQCGHVTNFAACTWKVRNTHGGGYQDLGDAIVTVLCGVLLILSSMGLSAALVSGMASPSRAASSGVGMATKKALQAEGVAKLVSKFKGG
ncbi:hypothetical protein [Vibrio europaeus]|uniref:hypothetical protein n=1 Tax=Vibrio europaeus TaxID=300876 RepID=UPI00233ECF25|nr:hypothetical protein [Vibrio europaeus]MDC5711165.1 hypothetical protein [Vibrio europaeus]MDC5713194.1 hypothetical protein [Vibrio europaeus]